MKFKLSRHAHEEIERRGIPLKSVDSVLHNPLTGCGRIWK